MYWYAAGKYVLRYVLYWFINWQAHSLCMSWGAWTERNGSPRASHAWAVAWGAWTSGGDGGGVDPRFWDSKSKQSTWSLENGEIEMLEMELWASL